VNPLNIPVDSEEDGAFATIRDFPDDRELARGRLFANVPGENQFLPDVVSDPVGLETCSQVHAVTGQHRYHLADWTRSQQPFASYYTFRIVSVEQLD
jgi:hypothetical protein